jgi:hypothetical protein
LSIHDVGGVNVVDSATVVDGWMAEDGADTLDAVAAACRPKGLLCAMAFEY